jgi:UDPglucose 6-dehydrogenase
MDAARRVFAGQSGITFAGSHMDALDRADALLIVTEWKAFRAPDFDAIKSRLRQPVVIDGRNLYDPSDMRRRGIEYFTIGRK